MKKIISLFENPRFNASVGVIILFIQIGLAVAFTLSYYFDYVDKTYFPIVLSVYLFIMSFSILILGFSMANYIKSLGNLEKIKIETCSKGNLSAVKNNLLQHYLFTARLIYAKINDHEAASVAAAMFFLEEVITPGIATLEEIKTASKDQGTENIFVRALMLLNKPI